MPSHHPSGVSTADRQELLWEYGLPDPSKWHVFFTDFDHHSDADWNITVVEAGAGSASRGHLDDDGGALLITNDNAANDYTNMQLGQAGTTGESFLFEDGVPLVFKARFRISDITNTVFHIGLSITDTDFEDAGAASDQLIFRTDTNGALHLCIQKNGVGGFSGLVLTGHTMVVNEYVTAAFLYDGANLFTQINSSPIRLVTGKQSIFGEQWNTGAFALPDDEVLSISMHLDNNTSASATQVGVDYIFCAKERRPASVFEAPKRIWTSASAFGPRTAGFGSPSHFPSGVSTAADNSFLFEYGLPNPTKWHTYFEDFDSYDANLWSVTEVGVNTQVAGTVDGGMLRIDNAAGANNNTNMISGGGREIFRFEAGKKLFFKTRFRLNHGNLPTQARLYAGLALVDTDVDAGFSDGVLLTHNGIDARALVHKNGSAITDEVDIGGFIVIDQIFVDMSFYYDGAQLFAKSGINSIVNVSNTHSILGAPVTIPDDEELAITIQLDNRAQTSAVWAEIDYIFAAKER